MLQSDVEKVCAYERDEQRKCHKNGCATELNRMYVAHLFRNTFSAYPFYRHFLHTVLCKTN